MNNAVRNNGGFLDNFIASQAAPILLL